MLNWTAQVLSHTAIDRDKSRLLDAVRVADALRNRPHIHAANAQPGEDRVTFTTLAGNGFDLTLQDAEPTTDDILPSRGLTEALAAADGQWVSAA
ncbi:hypothetical protein T261_1552 [Streptomyces lydicus]|nr:hypothetical protein T261_1552 [Streptomyces lydicus]